MKAILIGRHDLLPAQQKALELLQVEIVEKIPKIDNVEEFVKYCKERSIDTIIVQALPIDLLAQILKHNFTVYFMKMQQIALVESEEDAKKLVAEKPDRRVAIPSALGEKRSFRIMEFVGITRVKRILIDEEFVVKV